MAVVKEQRLRLSCITWKSYVTFCDGLGPRHIRMTYDQGELEIMTMSSSHERQKSWAARMVETLTEEMQIDMIGFGSMTCRREDMMKGLEPDEAFWIQNEPFIRDREEIDLETDPPPDLALEVEVTRGTLDRMSIYAALRVPEVWRWDGKQLLVCLLTEDGSYDISDKSLAFPFLPLQEFTKFLTRTRVSETQLIRSFRTWVNEQIAAEWKTKKKR